MVSFQPPGFATQKRSNPNTIYYKYPLISQLPPLCGEVEKSESDKTFCFFLSNTAINITNHIFSILHLNEQSNT